VFLPFSGEGKEALGNWCSVLRRRELEWQSKAQGWPSWLGWVDGWDGWMGIWVNTACARQGSVGCFVPTVKKKSENLILLALSVMNQYHESGSS
jgi:hypothetical protein